MTARKSLPKRKIDLFVIEIISISDGRRAKSISLENSEKTYIDYY